MIVASARTAIADVGGNSRYLREVAAGLREGGTSVKMLGPAHRSPLSWARFEAAQLQTSARRLGATDVWFPADTGPIRRRRGVRTTVTVHGVGVLHEPGLRSASANLIWKERTKAALRAADQIITVSHASADDIVTLAGPSVADRITVIHHGVGSEWFEAPPRQALAEDLVIAEPYAVFFGNLEPRKNLPLAVHALERVREQMPDLQFVVSGKPLELSNSSNQPGTESPEDPRSLFVGRPWIRYVGRRTDAEVQALLHGASLFVFPSRYEGFGLPALEAMACGTPVVVSDRGSLPEVVGDAGEVVSSLDVDAFADGCVRALSRRDHYAEVGPQRARSFTWQKSVLAHQELFDG